MGYWNTSFTIFQTDVPLSIRALLYFPEGKPGLFELSRDTDIGVALYTRKILIQSKTENLLPKWLRFIKGKPVWICYKPSMWQFFLTIRCG